jgi:hypothetical protein
MRADAPAILTSPVWLFTSNRPSLRCAIIGLPRDDVLCGGCLRCCGVAEPDRVADGLPDGRAHRLPHRGADRGELELRLCEHTIRL